MSNQPRGGSRIGLAAMREQLASLQERVKRQDEVLSALQIVNRRPDNG